jgi:MYXO-CTERM domain-containing protein
MCISRSVALAALCATAGAALARDARADWNGGDPAASSVASLAAFHWTTNAPSPGYRAYAFDNFVWTNTGGGMVGTIGGYYTTFNGTPITGVSAAAWEIRSGMSPGNGGTLVASGVGVPAVSPTGFIAGQPGNPTLSPVLRVELDVADFALAPGNYWVALSIGDAGVGSSGFVVETLGANSIGTGINDGQALYFQGDGVNMPPWDYVDVTTTWGAPMDMAYFVTEVPAPGPVALLGFGGLIAARRRR